MGGGTMSSLERAGTKLPVTMGHEIGGEVVEIGPDAQGVKLGDKVIVYPWLGCGVCPVCERGDDHLCPRASRNLGIQLPGGYADLVRVPHAKYLVPIGSLEPARAATFACAGITAYGAISKLNPMTAEDHVAVIGCGGVGMTAVALLSATSPAKVVAIDPDPAKREAALRNGAAAGLRPQRARRAEDHRQGLQHERRRRGGLRRRGISSSLAVNLVRRTGQAVVIVGLFGGEFRMPLPMFALKSIQISGSYVAGVNELRELVALAQRHQAARDPAGPAPAGQREPGAGRPGARPRGWPRGVAALKAHGRSAALDMERSVRRASK